MPSVVLVAPGGSVIDPITAVAAASKAYAAIKFCVEHGKEAEDTFAQVAKWYGAASDVLYDEQRKSNPHPFKRLVFSKSVEQTALEALIRKKKIEKQRAEINSLIGMVYGKEALKELRQIKQEVIKERQRQVYAQQELKESILSGVVIIAGLAFLIATVIFIMTG